MLSVITEEDEGCSLFDEKNKHSINSFTLQPYNLEVTNTN